MTYDVLLFPINFHIIYHLTPLGNLSKENVRNIFMMLWLVIKLLCVYMDFWFLNETVEDTVFKYSILYF
jgi:hypothetical protein